MKRLYTFLGSLIVLLLMGTITVLAAKSKLPAIQEPETIIQADKSQNQPTPTAPGQAQPVKPKSAAPNFDLDWFTINGGGDSYGSSTNYRLGYSVGQSVAGEGSSASYNLGIGFWYGTGPLCLAMPGDVNGSPPINLPDIIHLVNYVFDKDRPATSCLGSDPGYCWEPDPVCRGEINGTPPINLPDIIHLVNYVFDKDRPATSCLGSNPGYCWPPLATGTCCLPVP